jgi:hypothetical protein
MNMSEENRPVESQAESSGSSPAAPNRLQIELDDAMAQGAYVNFAIVGHTDTEFTLDFIFVQPHQPKGKVRARLISAPSHAKRFLKALDENIKKYEKSFGPIKAATEPEKKIGFSKT